MNNLGVLERLIKNLGDDISDNYNLITGLSIFVGINLLIAIANIIVQFKLKNKEKEINNHNLREEKRIEHQEELYKMLEELTYFNGAEKDHYHEKLVEINKCLTQKRLYLEKPIISVAQKFTDYFLSVLSDYRKKDYKQEIILLEEYSKEFNNVRS